MFSQPVDFATNATCFVIPDAVSPSDCQALIDRAEAAGIQVTQPDYPPSYRNNDRLVFDDPGLAAWLYERLRPFLPAHLSDDRGELSCVGLNPRFRVCRYQDGQSFRIHQDGAHAQDADTVTRLTCQLYLNSAAAFSGGATRFYAGRKGPLLGGVRPVCGQVIVFDHLLWHDGEPVTDGCKYVLRSDVLYRRRQPKPSPAAPSDDNVLSGHRGYVWSVVALGPGRIASASRDRTIRIWHTSGPRPQCVAAWNAAAASVSCLAYHDGALWSGSRDHTVTRWDLATGVHAVVHRGDGAVLGFASQQQRLLVHDAAGVLSILASDGARHSSHKVSQTWLWSVVCVSPTQVVCGDEEGVLRLCELPTVQDERRPGRGAVHALVTLEDGRICAGFASGHLALYQVAEGQLVEQTVWKAHDAEVYSVVHHQGRLASGGEDGQLHEWDVSGPPCLVGSHPHPAFVRSVAQDQHGILWTGCYDGLVRRFERK